MIARSLSFFAPAAVLSAWGTVMLHTVATGHITRLLSPMFRSYVVVAGVLLLLFAAAYLFLYQPAEDAAPALAPTGRLRQLLRWIALLVPLVAASVMSPDALSSTTMANRAAPGGPSSSYQMPSFNQATSDDIKAAQSADPSQPVPVEVTDLITLSHLPGQMQSFDGRLVRTVGLAENGKLVRWIMWCCAADAQPASVQLAGNLDAAGPLKNDAWYEVVGKAEFPSTLGQIVPRIDVQSIKPAQEPDEPYLSP